MQFILATATMTKAVRRLLDEIAQAVEASLPHKLPQLVLLGRGRAVVVRVRLIRRRQDELRKAKKAGTGRELSGRQTLRLIYEWFLTNEADNSTLTKATSIFRMLSCQKVWGLEEMSARLSLAKFQVSV